MIRPNNPEFKTNLKRWLIGFDVVHLSTGIRFVQFYLGPFQFSLCY